MDSCRGDSHTNRNAVTTNSHGYTRADKYGDGTACHFNEHTGANGYTYPTDQHTAANRYGCTTNRNAYCNSDRDGYASSTDCHGNAITAHKHTHPADGDEHTGAAHSYGNRYTSTDSNRDCDRGPNCN
jgi:hypothetical protein